ncbi:MAG: DUF4339 domain-containing protein [Planctomycetota bacterium]|nr:MAG: DUF4339 domain-containing protein [Planctomycetota bacterium]
MSERLEVIKWEDRSGGRTMVQRVPEQGMGRIKLGARVIVQEGQAAVFYHNGKAMDTMRAGSHTLTTENVPILSRAFNLLYQDAPFQSAVYFVSLKPFRDLKWGTKEAILLRDKEFGYVNVRAFGKYSVRITNPGVFLQTVVVGEDRKDADEIGRWFKDVLVGRFADLLSEYMADKSVLDLQAKRDELGVALKARSADDLSKYGIELYDFIVSSISLPEEVKKAINARSSMGALGIGPGGAGYMQMMAANALGDAAKNPGQPGGVMGAGLGMGMGMMMPQMMAGAMQPAFAQPAPGYGAPPGPAPTAVAPPPLPASTTFHAAIGGAQQGPFDLNALRGLLGQGRLRPETLVWRAGMPNWTPAKDVPELAALFAPPAAPPPLPGGAPPPLPS